MHMFMEKMDWIMINYACLYNHCRQTLNKLVWEENWSFNIMTRISREITTKHCPLTIGCFIFLRDYITIFPWINKGQLFKQIFHLRSTTYQNWVRVTDMESRKEWKLLHEFGRSVSVFLNKYMYQCSPMVIWIL